MTKGGLLPAPNVAAAPGEGALSYGLPISIIVVKDLTISVKWAGQEQSSLGNSGGFLGPFSLAGASAVNSPDGSWTYSRPGMQVVALLCSLLPVLPPKDAPDVAAAAGTSDTPTAAADPGSPPPADTTASSAGNTANTATSTGGSASQPASPDGVSATPQSGQPDAKPAGPS
jgi:hypothetical protein